MMHVPDAHLNCVVFLCIKEQGDNGELHLVPKATGFFVRVRVNQTALAEYIVTARHCIEEARTSGTLFIRVNRKGGGFIEIPTAMEDWVTNDNADVAAISLPQELPSNVNWNELVKIAVDFEQFVGPGPKYEWHGTPFGNDESIAIQPRAGHQIFFVGLFTQAEGSERNLPIARFGHISRMPSEITMGPEGMRFKASAYLAELHSWGGHSGSPAFFLYPQVLQDNQRSEDGIQLLDTRIEWTMVVGFLGLVSGHYEISKDAKTSGDVLGKIQTELNSGIAIITPAEAVKNLLMKEEFIDQRKASLEGNSSNKA